MLDALVIGGGVGGLASALRLRQRLRARGGEPRIAVLEADAVFGGVVRTRRAHGCVLEEGPDALLRSHPAGMALIHELGLDDQVIATEPDARRGLIARGARLLPVPEGLYLMAPGRLRAFAASPVLSPIGKLRALADLVIARRDPALGDESLADFVRRRLGREALARLAQPLASGIHTGDPERLSLSAAFPQLAQMEAEHGSLIRALRARRRDPDFALASGPRYGLFASLRGGLGALIERLRERLDGCELRTGVAVAALERDGEAWTARSVDGGTWRAARVVIAGPAHLAASLVAGWDASLAATLAAIEYAGVATINLGYAADALSLPAAAGCVVPAVEGRSLIAATFSSRKWSDRAAPGTALVRAFVGGALNAQRLAQDDATLVAQAVADLAALLRPRAAPRFALVHRWPRSMAQPTLGHAARLAAVRAGERRHPGLALVGNGYEGVGIPQICAQAEAMSARLGDVAQRAS